MWFAHTVEQAHLAIRAKKACLDCAIREQCLADNLDVPEGIFGAFDAAERKMLREGTNPCSDCRKLLPASQTICVPCSKRAAKERAKERLRAAAQKRGKS